MNFNKLYCMNNELVAIKLLYPDIFITDDIINFKKLFNSLDVKQ